VRPALLAISFLSALLLLPGRAAAQTPQRDEAAGWADRGDVGEHTHDRHAVDEVHERVVRAFDFEERDDGNFEDQPMHFARVAGPGMPHWVRGRLTPGQSHTGRYSLRLDLNGGSVVYRSRLGLMPVLRGGTYRVLAHVRTTPLDFARARVTVYCVDAEGNVIPGSVSHSQPYTSTPTPTPEEPDWVHLLAQTSAVDPKAAWLVVELALLQPGEGGWPTAADGGHDELLRFRQDIEGSAWFDDVIVSRVPVVTIERHHPGGIVPDGRRLTFEAIAEDAELPDLQAAATVTAADGTVVWTGPGLVTPPGPDEPAAADRADTVAWTRYGFDVGILPAGWYEATVTVGQPGSGVEARTTRSAAFLVLPPGAGPAVTGRLGADASHLPASAWEVLPEVAATAGIGRLAVSIWGGPGGNDLAEEPQRFDRLASALRESEVGLIAVFAGPTPTLEALADRAGWSALLPVAVASDPGETMDNDIRQAWRAALSIAVAQHSHQIDRYQFGRGVDADRLGEDRVQRRILRATVDLVKSLDADARVGAAWPARRSVAPLLEDGPVAAALRVPADVLPRQLPLYVADARGSEAMALSLDLELLSSPTHGRLARISDLAKRVTFALATGTAGVTVPLPVAVDPEQGTFEPREELLVIRTLATHLAGQRYAGRVPAGEVGQGVAAHLFADEEGRGTLVIWSRAEAGELTTDANAQNVSLRMNLGRDAQQIDLWGNATRLEQSSDARRDGAALIPVGPIPTLVTGVDAAMTRLRQTVRLDSAMIESSFEPHGRRLLMTNTFPHAIAGTIRLRAPEGWDVTLTDPAFSLGAGESLARPVELRIPYNSDAGEHRIDAEIRLRGGPDLRVIRVPIVVRVGLTDIGLRTVARRNGNDLLVEQTVTNYGDRPANYNAFVVVPGNARQERLILELGPGQTTIKRYRFRNASDLEPGTHLRSGLRELEGTRILNDRVEL
jgi:hypothetical protein